MARRRFADFATARDRRGKRIGVIGAGAAGLSAAKYLGDAGYEDVVVIEKSDRPGGKCFTKVYEGRTYELGAGAITPNYRHVRSLMAEVGVKAEPRWSGLYLDPERGTKTVVPPPLGGLGWLRTTRETARFLRLLWRYRGITQPGFEATHPDLHRSLRDFAREARVEQAVEIGAPFFTGFGYGYAEETPAAYFLKYATIGNVPMELFRDGFGGLWRAVARNLTVRYEVDIDRVERAGGSVRVHTSAETFDFDALIVACPLDVALGWLDASSEETELFSKVRYNPYYALGAVVRDFPSSRWMFAPRNFRKDRPGEPMFIYRRYRDSDLVFFYGHADDADPQPPRDAVERFSERFGARVLDVPIFHHWRYCPHVTSDDMAAGFYPRLEALQGERATWYVGEALSYGVVEMCAAYSKALVDECFA